MAVSAVIHEQRAEAVLKAVAVVLPVGDTEEDLLHVGHRFILRCLFLSGRLLVDKLCIKALCQDVATRNDDASDEEHNRNSEDGIACDWSMTYQRDTTHNPAGEQDGKGDNEDPWEVETVARVPQGMGWSFIFFPGISFSCSHRASFAILTSMDEDDAAKVDCSKGGKQRSVDGDRASVVCAMDVADGQREETEFRLEWGSLREFTTADG